MLVDELSAHGLDNGDGGGTYANGVLETGEIDSSTTFCSRFAIEMLKDINSGSSSSSPLRSQPLVTPFISAPMTGPTEKNCGRVMELPQAR